MFIKINLFVILFSSLFLVGCSTTNSSKNASDVIDYDANTDYRKTETKLSKALDAPPNLFLKVAKNNDAKLLSTANSLETKKIPTFSADNVQIKSNLSEKWLELKNINNANAWQGVHSFLISLGFKVKDSRKDIGFIKTEFLKRTELVPLDAQGPLTRLLNSWRPELAEGISDRLVARLESNEQTSVIKVYFYHYMVAETTGDVDSFLLEAGWKVKPYNPMFEAEALYQAAIFFGVNNKIAYQQIKRTASFLEGADNEQEFISVNLNASKEKSWDYFMAMVYRAGWTVSEVKKSHFSAIINLSAEIQHKQVQFSLETVSIDGNSYSNLSVNTLDEDEPLTENERKKLYQKLALLPK